MTEFVELQPVKLSGTVTERQLHEFIKANPTILGIPNVEVYRSEHVQPGLGRVDLVLQSTSSHNKRYEVEIQLKATDASHIIRTIEYWDVEQQRYPQYDHCAVIVAEDITSRFFNVIGLFNGHIPIIAINVTAVKQQDGNIGLVFTRVLNERRCSAKEDSSEALTETSSKEQWVALYGEKAAEIAEHFCDKLGAKSRYLKFYIRTDDDNADLHNKITIRKVGKREKPRLVIDVKVSSSSWQEFFAREDLGGEADFEDWGYYEDGSGVWLKVANTKQIDDSIDLLQKLYCDAAGISQPSQGTAADSNVDDSGGESDASN